MPVPKDILEAECILFSTYLIGERPGEYVLEKYTEAHLKSNILKNSTGDDFDDLLLRIARKNVVITKLVDVYSSLFLKTSTVRKKCILLLAILECCAPSCEYFESPESSTKTALQFQLVSRGLRFLLVGAISVMILLPIHIALSLRSRLFP